MESHDHPLPERTQHINDDDDNDDPQSQHLNNIPSKSVEEEKVTYFIIYSKE